MEHRNFPLYLPFRGDRTYSILGYIGQVDTYIDNKGYIDEATGKIYICSKDKPPVHDDTPVIYVKDDGTYTLKDVNAPQVAEVFRDAYLYDLSMPTILNTTKEHEVLYNAEALADMNAATTVFIPTINETDDPLKKIVKQLIISKKIDINRLKHRLPEKYGLTNMKSALIGKTKMSINNFNMWFELLGATYEITVSDNGTDAQNPLIGQIRYSSDTNRLVEE